jgi:hypothetical protein
MWGELKGMQNQFFILAKTRKNGIYFTLRSGSRSLTAMAAFWGKRAQHIGVAKVRQKPQRRTCRGALAHLAFARVPRRSKVFITSGGITKVKLSRQYGGGGMVDLFLPMPGEAIPMRLRTTATMPSLAAFADSPNLRPSASTTGTPSCSSLENI